MRKRAGSGLMDLWQGYLALPRLPWEQLVPAAPIVAQQAGHAARKLTVPSARLWSGFHDRLFRVLADRRAQQALRRVVKTGSPIRKEALTRATKELLKGELPEAVLEVIRGHERALRPAKRMWKGYRKGTARILKGLGVRTTPGPVMGYDPLSRTVTVTRQTPFLPLIPGAKPSEFSTEVHRQLRDLGLRHEAYEALASRKMFKPTASGLLAFRNPSDFGKYFSGKAGWQPNPQVRHADPGVLLRESRDATLLGGPGGDVALRARAHTGETELLGQAGVFYGERNPLHIGQASRALAKMSSPLDLRIQQAAFHEALSKWAASRTIGFVGPDDVVVPVDVEVASTEPALRKGLMHRGHLSDGTGMLFDFGDEAERSFWMRNVPIPLDMVFVKADGIVAHVVHSASPMSDESHPSEVPVRCVVEVPGGFCGKRGIQPGWRMVQGG